MKVLWFTNTPANADEYFQSELKGTGGWLKALDQALQEQVELHIAFYKDYQEPFKYKGSYYYPIKPNNSIYKKILGLFGHNLVINDEDIGKYIKIINHVKPDIIHIHGTENPFACIIPFTKIPVVVSIQGNLTVYLHKYFSGIEQKYLYVASRDYSSFKSFFIAQRFASSYRIFRKMQKREYKNFGFIKNFIGRTDWDRRITRVLSPGSNYFHGDEMLRESFYNYKWVPHEREKYIIHTTNSNTYYKGFETLCLALNELNRMGFNCEWQVAGISPNDLIVKVIKKKLKINFPKSDLILLGNLNEEHLVRNLLNADVFVMVSHIENSPNNLCEAMMLGMPCISTFVGGSGSLVQDKINGILVQSGDPWVMAGAILEIANNMESAILYGNSARQNAQKRHSHEIIIRDLCCTYEEIISDNRT